MPILTKKRKVIGMTPRSLEYAGICEHCQTPIERQLVGGGEVPRVIPPAIFVVWHSCSDPNAEVELICQGASPPS